MDYNLFKGLVTHIIDPSNFWMRIGMDSDMQRFMEYQRRLNKFYNTEMTKYTCSPDQMHDGYLVVVAVSGQDHWYHWERAQVIRIDSKNNTVDVFFVDLGYTDIVDVGKCCAITSDIFGFLPAQASRVSLGGVKPLSNSWTIRATNLLQKKTKGQEVLTLLMHYDEISMCYTAVIYTRQRDGIWRSLIHEMQLEELAVSTNDKIQEVLTDYDVDQCFHSMEERHRQEKAEISAENDEKPLTGGEKEEIEKWEEENTAQESDKFLANLMDASHDVLHNQPPTSTNKQGMVTGFDYHTLMQTRSITLSQMQVEKEVETQEATKTNIERDLQRLDSSSSQHDEQDWDAIQDTDCHVDIVSQIYQGVLDRQDSTDDGMSCLLEGGKTHELVEPLKKKKSSSEISAGAASVLQDIGRRYYHQVDESEHDYGQENDKSNGLGSGDDVSGVDLSEMDRYHLEKQIKEILSNQDNLEADVVCVSIYSVVQPDEDAPMDHLCVVICAILEHIIQNSCQHSEIAFAILETYSGTGEFGRAMEQVINELKDRFVQKHQRARWSHRHKDFAQLLALVFKQAEDWGESVCKVVQDLAVALVERWVIFNKQRHLSGDELVKCELLYLEVAQVFLMECHNLLMVKYSSNLLEIMNDIRFKLLQDKTVSSVRTLLLDMLLTFYPGGKLGRSVVCSVGTQTENMEDVESNSMSTVGVGISGDYVSTKCIRNQPNTSADSPLLTESSKIPDYVPAQLDWNGLPKNIKRLPPRLLKKYVQEHALLESQPPLQTVDYPIDYEVTNEQHGGCSILDTITNIQENGSQVFYSLSQNNNDTFDQGHVDTNWSNNDKDDNEFSSLQGENKDVEQTFVMDEVSQSPQSFVETVPPSPNTAVERMSPQQTNMLEKMSQSPKPVMEEELLQPPETVSEEVSQLQKTSMEEVSSSPDTVVGETSPSPPPFLDSLTADEKCISKYNVQASDKKLAKAVTNVPSFSYPMENSCADTEKELDINQENEMAVTNQDSVDPETACTKKADYQSVTVSVRIERDKTIRYTPQQLKDLNQYKGLPKVPLWDLMEPKEVLEKMIILKNPGKCALDEERSGDTSQGNSKSNLNPFAKEFNLKVGCSSWKDKEQIESSVDPSSLSVRSNKQRKKNNSCKQTCGDLYEHDGEIYLNSGRGLQVIAADFFKSIDVKPDIAEDTETLPHATKGVDDGKSQGGGEMWHEESCGVVEAGELLKPKHRNELGKGKKAKKKRGREIPLDQFLQEQEALKKQSEEVENVELGIDSHHFDDGDNLFSPEALQMYEELEQQGVGMGTENEELPRVLLSSQIGSQVSSSSKRPSLYSSIRPEQPSGQKSSKQWAPASRRFCTRCGSKDHVVYDCGSVSSRVL